MATDKAALGRKYTCFSCTCKFYDMNAELAICPRCEADQADDPNPPLDPALLFRQPRGSRKKKAVEPDPVSEEEEEESDDDTSDLDTGDDDDDDGPPVADED